MKKILFSLIISLLFLTNSAFGEITTGLVAHYEFEDNINDSSGNDFNLTGINSAYTSGKIGKAYQFNASDNNLTALNTGLNDLNGTVSYWIKSTSTSVNTLLALATNNSPSFDTYLDASGILIVNAFNSGVAVNDGSWHHIAIAFAGVNTTKIYIDGNLTIEDTSSGKDLNLDTDISVGHWNGAYQHADSMDDIRIYNRELNATDIAELYSYIPTASNTDCYDSLNIGTLGTGAECNGKLIVDRSLLDSMITNDSNLTNDVDITNVFTGQITDMTYLFNNNSVFDQNISQWDTSNVTEIYGIFYGASSFNQDISNWNISNVTDMSDMFKEANDFNQSIGDWNTSNVTMMNDMFFAAANFNQDISNWNTSNVTNMSSMFQEANAFNQDISNWNTSNVTNMSSMFLSAVNFNQSIGDWNTSNVVVMNSMFSSATNFHQDISTWCVSNITLATDFDVSSGFENNSTLQPQWGYCPISEGTSGDDNITGTEVSNIINAGDGNDTIDGGYGSDIAVFSGNQAEYIIANNNNIYTVTGPDGVDTLVNIEYLNFDDVQNVAIDYNTLKLTLKAHGGVVQFISDSNSSFVSNINSPVTSTTVEFWINTKHETNTSHVIGGLYGDNGQRIEVMMRDNKLIYEASDETNTTTVFGGTTINDGLWHQVTLSFDDTTFTNVSVDGIYDYNDGGGVDPSAFILNNAQVKFNPDNIIDMMIDEIRIWDTTKTQSDINATMTYQLSGSESGLIAYYNFDERVGDTVYDIAKNTHDGALEGNITRLNFLGDGLNFDGVDDFMYINNPGGYQFENNMTIGLWIQYDENHTGYRTLVSNTEGGGYGIYIDSSLIGEVYINNKYLTVSYPKENLKNGWNYLSLIYDGTDLKLYVDGEEKVSDSNGTYPITYSYSNCLTIGADAESTCGDAEANYDTYFKGSIAEVSVWDKVLNSEEVKQNMYSIPDLTDINLVGYWPLNEGNGIVTKDYSISSNDGNVTGATWVDTAPTIYGENIYTSAGISLANKLYVESNMTTPVYSYKYASIPSTILDFNGTSGDFIYNSSMAGKENLYIDADDNGTSLNSKFKVIVYGDLYFDISLLNASLVEHNLTNIQIIGTGNNSQNLLIPDIADGNISDGSNSYSVPIFYTPDNYFTIRLDTNDSNETISWWYNFADNKLYEDNNGSSNFKQIIDSSNSSLTFDLNSSNFITGAMSTSAPRISNIYSRVRTPGFGTISIDFEIEDTDSSTLSLATNSSDPFVSISLPSTASANSSVNLTLTELDASSSGYTDIEVKVSDQYSTTETNIQLFIENKFEMISNKESDDIGYTDSLSYKYTGSVYILNSSHENYESVVTYEKIDVNDSVIGSIVEVKDINGVVKQDDIKSDMDDIPSNIAYDSSVINMTSLNTLYSAEGIPFTFTDINDSSEAQKVYVKYSDGKLNIKDENSSNYVYSTLEDFMLDQVIDRASYGLLRDRVGNKLLVFDNTNNDLAYATSGTLIEIDENGTVLNDPAGTWNKQTFNGTSLVSIHPTESGYRTDAAFALENSLVKEAEFKDVNEIYSYIFLNRSAKDEIYSFLSPSPQLAFDLVEGYNYISLPYSKPLCDNTLQSGATSICDQNNTLESIFTLNSDIKNIFKYTDRWNYWDKEVGINASYLMNKFSLIGTTDGVLVYSDNITTINMPFDFEDEELVNYESMPIDMWQLVSNNKTQTVQEIKTAVEAATSIESKSIMYIQVFRGDEWYIYAPTNDSQIDPSIRRLNTIQRYESFWILLKESN